MAEIEAKYNEESLRQKLKFEYDLEKVKGDNGIALENLNIEKEKEIMEYNNKALIIDKLDLDKNQVYDIFCKLIPQNQEQKQMNNNINSNHGPGLIRSNSFCVPNTQMNYNINNQYMYNQNSPMNMHMYNGVNSNYNMSMNIPMNYYTPRYTNYNNQMYMNNYQQVNNWQNNMQNPHGLRKCYSQVFQ